jgi:hypothetical protein
MTSFRHEDMPTVISYADIPRYCDGARSDRPYTFLLSRQQADLYRAKLQHELTSSGHRSPFSVVTYAWILVRILLTCRFVLLLGQFHEFYPNDLGAITFEETSEGVLVKMNPHRPRLVPQ